MGWTALFTRGLGLRIIMIGTLTGLQWGIYDAYKVSVGLPTTGHVEEVRVVARALVRLGGCLGVWDVRARAVFFCVCVCGRGEGSTLNLWLAHAGRLLCGMPSPPATVAHTCRRRSKAASPLGMAPALARPGSVTGARFDA